MKYKIENLDRLFWRRILFCWWATIFYCSVGVFIFCVLCGVRQGLIVIQEVLTGMWFDEEWPPEEDCHL